MAKNTSLEAMKSIVDILTPLSSEERTRVVRASLVMLGENESIPNPQENNSEGFDNSSSGLSQLPPRASAWMKQNNFSIDHLQQVFHITDNGTEVIAVHIPGKNKKWQTFCHFVLSLYHSLRETVKYTRDINY